MASDSRNKSTGNSNGKDSDTYRGVPSRTAVILSDLIQDILPEHIKNAVVKPFNHGTAKKPPTLFKRVPNGILIFPGAFNPGHWAHARLLHHVFHNAGEDLNLIAAVLIVDDDENINDRKGTYPLRFHLSQKQRGALFRNGMRSDHILIWDVSSREWHQFCDQLSKKAEDGGFKLSLFLLAGPDEIHSCALTGLDGWNVKDVITSDISRPAEFRIGEQNLARLAGFTNWAKVKYARSLFRNLALRNLNLRWIGPHHKYRVEHEIIRIHKTCHGLQACIRQGEDGDTTTTIRFVPTRSEAYLPDISSTSIRNLILNTDADDLNDLVEDLHGLAMNAQLLISFMPEMLSKFLDGESQATQGVRTPSPDRATLFLEAALIPTPGSEFAAGPHDNVDDGDLESAIERGVSSSPSSGSGGDDTAPDSFADTAVSVEEEIRDIDRRSELSSELEEMTS